MRIISNKALVEFSVANPFATDSLQAWRKIIESRSFVNFSEIKSVFNATDKVAQHYIFDIGGNKYRVFSVIHFDRQKLFIRYVFTPKECDKWNP